MNKAERPLVIALLAMAMSILNGMVGFADTLTDCAGGAVQAVSPTNYNIMWMPGVHPPRTIIDMRGITFRLQASSNPNPDGVCHYTGANRIPTNPYPVMNPEGTNKATIDACFRGGRVIGGVSPTANRTVWSSNGGYCNSAAVFMKNGISTRQKIRSTRVDRAWDGFRIGGSNCRTPGTCHNLIRGVWATNVRDDCVENDSLGGLSIQDSLFDGCYSGVSADANASSSHAYTDTIELNGVLLRLQEFPDTQYGKKGSYLLAPFKINKASGPSLVINNSIIALASYDSSRHVRWETGWAKVKTCSNNQFLWLSDSPFPTYMFPKLPSCFTVKTGAAARATWTAARATWIANHPEVSRLASDPPVAK